MNSTNNTTAIIIAAGKSSRYGKNKLLLPINDKTLFEHCVQKVLKINFDEIIITIADEKINTICNSLDKKQNVKIVYNFNNNGIGTSIKKALLNSNKNNNYMFFVCDQPFLTNETIKNLINASVVNKIVRPIYNEVQGNPVIFPNYFRERLLNIEDNKGGMSIVTKDTEIITVPTINQYELMDIDTVNDYELVQKIINKTK